jgi:hypothetical protein
MASITEARLSISFNQQFNQIATVQITGQMLLDINDVGSFALQCAVFGDDLVFDDFLFQYQPKGVSGGGPTFVPFEFLSTEQRSILNEDVIGKDEIYANLTLRKNNEIGPIVSSRKSNVVQISA